MSSSSLLLFLLLLRATTRSCTLLSRRSRQRERLSASVLSICSSVCLSVARMQKTRFSQKLSNLELWSLLTIYRKSYMPYTGFSKNNMSTVVIWSKSKPDVEFQYGRRLGESHGMSPQSHVSHCTALPLGEFTVMIPEPHATLQDVIQWQR